MTRLLPERTLLLVVDVQEKLAAAVLEAQLTSLVRAATILIDSASFLGARVIATEQYPQGLGPTLGPVRTRLDTARAVVLSKTELSACDAAGFVDAIDHRAAGLDLCRAAGATVTTAETVVFDWLCRAGGDSFRAVSRLVR